MRPLRSRLPPDIAQVDAVVEPLVAFKSNALVTLLPTVLEPRSTFRRIDIAASMHTLLGPERP